MELTIKIQTIGGSTGDEPEKEGRTLVRPQPEPFDDEAEEEEEGGGGGGKRPRRARRRTT